MGCGLAVFPRRATKAANIPYVPSLEKEMRGRGDEVGDGLSHRALSWGSEVVLHCAYVNTIGEMACNNSLLGIAKAPIPHPRKDRGHGSFGVLP